MEASLLLSSAPLPMPPLLRPGAGLATAAYVGLSVGFSVFTSMRPRNGTK